MDHFFCTTVHTDISMQWHTHTGQTGNCRHIFKPQYVIVVASCKLVQCISYARIPHLLNCLVRQLQVLLSRVLECRGCCSCKTRSLIHTVKDHMQTLCTHYKQSMIHAPILDTLDQKSPQWTINILVLTGMLPVALTKLLSIYCYIFFTGNYTVLTTGILQIHKKLKVIIMHKLLLSSLKFIKSLYCSLFLFLFLIEFLIELLGSQTTKSSILH